MTEFSEKEVAELDAWVECLPATDKYPEREIYAYGRYIQCQILNWDKGEPPPFLVCHPLHKDYHEQFLARQAMGTWCRVDLKEALWLIANSPHHSLALSSKEL